jgi:membrane-associated phospholipid phosphatase
MFFCSFPGRALAGDAAPRPREPHQLRYDLRLDLTATAIASTGWLIMEAFNKDISPSACRWCGVDSFDAWGHRNLKWDDTRDANLASHAMAYGLSPIIAFGGDAIAAYHDGDLKGFGIDALVIAESAAVSSLISQVVKISVGRERPESHYGGIAARNGNKNTSFYSGHVNLAFTLAVASGTVATMRGYRLAPYIWGAGLAAAATTGYLRLAADKHYLTDVIGGAVIGSAIGFGIPYLFHRPHEDKRLSFIPSVMPVQGGAVVGISGLI